MTPVDRPALFSGLRRLLPVFIRSAPIGLWVISALLWGAKGGIEFSLWGVLCLLFCLQQLETAQLAFYSHDVFAISAFILGVLASECLSRDPSISLFWTTQLLVYSFCWLALRIECDGSFNEHLFDAALLPFGVITVLLTAAQEVAHKIPYGFLPVNPNFNAVWMAALAILLIGRLPSRLRTRRDWGEFMLAATLSALVICGHSRTALSAWVLGLCFLAFRKYEMKHALKWFIGLLLFAILLPGGWLWIRFRLPSENGLRADRAHFWQIAIQGIRDYPLAGYGPGNFELAYQRHPFPVMDDAVHFGRTTQFAHNDYLQALSELGIPTGGLLLLAVMWLLCRPVNPRTPITQPAKAALVTVSFSALFNPIFHMPFLVYFTLLLAAILTADPKGRKPLERRTNQSLLLVRSGFQLGIALTLVLTAWAGLRDIWTWQHRWDHIVAVDPWDADAWHNLAMQQTQTVPALAAYNRAVKLSPSQPYYQEALGRALEASRRSEDIPNALKAYHAALELAPARANVMLAIGRLLFREGHPSDARAWFERARQIEPYYWETDLWIARCAFLKGEKRSAISILKNLPKRRQQFLDQFGEKALPDSSYAQIILEYHDDAVQNQRRVFQNPKIR